jgi:hypothetical protein
MSSVARAGTAAAAQSSSARVDFKELAAGPKHRRAQFVFEFLILVFVFCLAPQSNATVAQIGGMRDFLVPRGRWN